MSSTKSLSSFPSSLTYTLTVAFKKWTANPHPASIPPSAETSYVLALCTCISLSFLYIPKESLTTVLLQPVSTAAFAATECLTSS
eukprot:9328938-Heterocapsa_arctica.AAC.1